MKKWIVYLTACFGGLLADEELRNLVECELGRSSYFQAIPKYKVVVGKVSAKETLELAADYAKLHAEEIIKGYDYSVVFSKGYFCQAEATLCTLYDGVSHRVGFTSKQEDYSGAFDNLVDSIEREMLWKSP